MFYIIKYIQFFVAISMVCLSKIWHDSFKSYLAIVICSAFSPDIILYMHRYGLMLGGAFAGIFTDAYSPKRTAIASMFMISTLSLAMSSMQFLQYLAFVCKSHNVIYFIAFIRGIFIGVAANAGYALIGQIFKDDVFLSKGTSILYITVLCGLTLFPLIIKYFYSVTIFTILSLFSLLILLLTFTLPKGQIRPLRLLQSIEDFALVITNKQIIICALISMIFVGGFYNLITMLQKITPYTLEEIQFIGRLATTSTLIFFMLGLFTYNSNKCNRQAYIIIALIMSLPLLLEIIAYNQIRHINHKITIISFILTCIGSAIAQPIGKSLMLISANSQSTKVNRNLCGNSQSLLTFSDILIEIIGAQIITRFSFAHYSICVLFITCILIYIHFNYCFVDNK